MASQTGLGNHDVDKEPRKGNIPFILDSGRTFLLNVPDAYDPGQPHPLVLSFHGGDGTSERQQRITQLSSPTLRIADKPFLTAYGQALVNQELGGRTAWQGAPYDNKNVDDIQYVRDILTAVWQRGAYHIDTSRVYACGKSNGGGLVVLLACHPDAPTDTFAALAVVSPALYDGTWAVHGDLRQRPPVPMLHVHGTKDTVTPFRGQPTGQGWGPLPDVRAWRRLWAERNGAGGGYPGALVQPDRVEEVHPGVWEEVWNCGPEGGSGAEVRALSVEGLGHSWPTTEGLDYSGRPDYKAGFNFTEEHLVQFFSRHSLV
ncbi:alpha/beta-hydrolase [Cryphonectria parasitica EP155]|uniref:feruloyl esterase n=1 Tax=Cryphonectria parasitica (strain ATCC 38755 / EP155) TaxID=660469 RepID=A0A9P4Y0I7_CRYP1|nr:alpha/beta-hydrolase [Cryphonectria parasitica EP155]KAF3764326.1 alpha/beta-hydrolase [Cryphonectria parasitica EP155]